MSYRDEIKQRLEGVEPKCCVAFAARTAFRCLPLLAVADKMGKGFKNFGEWEHSFWYWNEATSPKHLLNILSAERSSLAFSVISRSDAAIAAIAT